MYFNKFHVPKIQQNLLKLNNYRLLFVENSKLVTLTYFLILFVYKKSRAEVCKFLNFMDSPNNTYMKWPLTTY